MRGYNLPSRSGGFSLTRVGSVKREVLPGVFEAVEFLANQP